MKTHQSRCGRASAQCTAAVQYAGCSRRQHYIYGLRFPVPNPRVYTNVARVFSRVYTPGLRGFTSTPLEYSPFARAAAAGGN